MYFSKLITQKLFQSDLAEIKGFHWHNYYSNPLLCVLKVHLKGYGE